MTPIFLPDSISDDEAYLRKIRIFSPLNGGPSHLTRYRNPDASASLKEIDTAFWQKFRAIQAEGPMAVKGCLAG